MVQLFLGATALGSISTVLFDKDGTLSHSEPMLALLAEARIAAALELHAQTAPDGPRSAERLERLLRQAYGLAPTGLHPAGTIAVAARDHNLISTATVLAQLGHGWPEAVALSEEVFRRTDGQHGRGSRLAPQLTAGLRPLLDELKAAGVRCAVISNDHVEGIEAFLTDHALRDHFTALWSAEHHPRKPDPGAVHNLCAELGVEPEACALIGDANSDLRMAASAGVGVVLGYRGGWSQPVPLDSSFHLLHHWQELGVGRPGQPQPDGPAL